MDDNEYERGFNDGLQIAFQAVKDETGDNAEELLFLKRSFRLSILLDRLNNSFDERKKK